MEPIRSQFEDDPDMLELVCEFARELPARAEALECALASASLSELQRLAHQLKGAGGGYGFPQISEAAAELERSLKERRAEPVVKEQSRALCSVLRAVRAPEPR